MTDEPRREGIVIDSGGGPKVVIGGGLLGEQDDGRPALSARQKVRLYLTTLAVLAIMYVAPSALAFMREVIASIVGMPQHVWEAITNIVIAVLCVAGALGGYAILQIFSTGKKALDLRKPPSDQGA